MSTRITDTQIRSPLHGLCLPTQRWFTRAELNFQQQTQPHLTASMSQHYAAFKASEGRYGGITCRVINNCKSIMCTRMQEGFSMDYRKSTPPPKIAIPFLNNDSNYLSHIEYTLGLYTADLALMRKISSI